MLSPLAQQIFIRTRTEGMKQAEVAAKLNIHITTVVKNLADKEYISACTYACW